MSETALQVSGSPRVMVRRPAPSHPDEVGPEVGPEVEPEVGGCEAAQEDARSEAEHADSERSGSAQEVDLECTLAGYLPPHTPAGEEPPPEVLEAPEAPLQEAHESPGPEAEEGGPTPDAFVGPPELPAEPEGIRLSVPRPRCPFCHEGIAPGVLQEGCKACRAWHHEACWREGRSRCSACGAPAVKQAIQVRVGPGSEHPGVDSDLAMSWTVVATGAVAYSLVQIPLRDTYRLHQDTLGHALTNAWSAIPTIAALSALFVAAALRPGRWRNLFHWGAWGVVALTAILALCAAASPPQVPWSESGFGFRAF